MDKRGGCRMAKGRVQRGVNYWRRSGLRRLRFPTGVGFAEGPTIASGHVFHDRSGTGRRSGGDPGIPGVMVSNGRDVVVTDSDGRWRLSIAEGDGIFVIKPPHWTTPYGFGGVPRLSFAGRRAARDIHRHAGCPMGAPPAGIDFPLRPQEESTRFERAAGRHTARQRRRTRVLARRHHRGRHRN